MVEANQSVSSKIGENIPSVKPTVNVPNSAIPTAQPGPEAQVRNLTTKDLVHEILEERKELIGALRNTLQNLMGCIQDLIAIDERAMGVYHKELYPEEAAEAQKKYDAKIKAAKEKQATETPK